MKGEDELEGSDSEILLNPSEVYSHEEPEVPRVVFNIDASPSNADWANGIGIFPEH